MSLPPAKKEISAHPSPGTITAPVDKHEKDVDVERKASPRQNTSSSLVADPAYIQLRFFGVIEAFRKGRMPSNKQIDETLKYVVDQDQPVDTEKLSPGGQKLIHDVKDIIETARRIVSEKNADEMFQYFIWHTREVDREALVPGETSAKGEKTKEDTEQGLIASSFCSDECLTYDPSQ